jgi:NAD(P)-dependent dehydrogenase (short-subunit alcohol dehydrogenase family)
MFDLKDRKALITGAGQGMGFGIAKALAKHGAHVFINDLYEDRTAKAVKNLNDLGLSATPLPGDITDPEIRGQFKEYTGNIDILVNNAGVPEGMPTSLAHADKLAEADYQKQMDLNHHAVRALCALYLPGMRETGHGRILIITSESHRLGLSMGLSHYAAAKSATLGYMRALAAEVGHDGVTVNALSLGTMNNFDGHERAATSTLIGRAGTPEDVGAAALYLVSDEAGWMTGQTIPLNGGACTA